MNEIEEWFLEEFGHLGFELTPMVYCPYSFDPVRKVIYRGEEVPHMRIATRLLAHDLSSAFDVDVVEEYRTLVRQGVLRFLENRKDKDFKPMQKLNKFKL